MHLLHVIAGAEIGGAETFARDTIAGLAGAGIRQTVVCRPFPDSLARFAAAGVRTVPLDFSWLDRVRGAPARLRRMARETGADLVHAWMSRAASFVPPAMPCPVIGWFGDTYDMKYFRQVDACIGVTPDIVRWTLAHGTAPHRAFLVNTFGTMPDCPPVSRHALNVPDGAALLLVLSRLHPVKGIDTLLRALVEVPGAFLCVAGDGPARGEYEALSRRLGLSDRVRFLGWRNDRRALLEACDICVLPSRYEPFGTVILEAWAALRPLVATRADGARQYVEDGRTGLVCPIDDPPALAACLRRVVADEAGLRRRLAEAGHARYIAEFTEQRVLERLQFVYRTAIALGPSSRDVVVPVSGLDSVRLGRLSAGLAEVAPTGQRGRAARAAAVALAYADAGRSEAVAAAMCDLAGPGGWLQGVGRQARVVLAPTGHATDATSGLPHDAAPEMAHAAEWLHAALVAA